MTQSKKSSIAPVQWRPGSQAIKDKYMELGGAGWLRRMVVAQMDGYTHTAAKSGRPAPSIDVRRVMLRVERGDTQQAIADAFGVAKHVIQYVVKKQKQINNEGQP